MITLKLTQSVLEIEKEINKAIAKEFNGRIRSKNKRVLGVFKRSIESWVMSQPEIQSLLSQGEKNSLNAQFGLTPGVAGSSVARIVNSVVESTEVEIKKIDEKLNGGVIFKCQTDTFSNLLGLPEGHVVTKKGADLHWLDWILTQGDRAIIIGYDYEPSGDGRSGGGTMKGGKSFRVSPSFSGTPNNNFITRALSGKETEITNILMGIFA